MFQTKQILIVFLVLTSFITSIKSQCNNIPVDLNTWNAQGGAWTVSPTGNSVLQTVNGGAVYFLSPQQYINTQINGTLRTDDSDNDRMGFVFGVQGVIGTAPFHYYRFEWDEGGDGDGMYVYEYDETGLVSTLLANPGSHWVRSSDHTFTIDYFSSNITLLIDGVEELNIEGCFNPGQFGFFNSSQANVTYSNFTSSPEADFTFNNIECFNIPINTSIFCDNTIPNPYQTIIWDFGDGTIINDVVTASHTYLTPGNYDISLYIKDFDGCESTIVKPVIINPTPVTNFTVDDVCLEDVSIFQNTSTISVPGNIASYKWTLGDGTTLTDRNHSHTYTSEGTYNLKLITESNEGCLDSIITTTRVYPKPEAGFSVNDDCVNIAAQFTDNSSVTSGSITDWEWNFDDSSPLNLNQSPSYTYANDGTFEPQLIVTSNYGCKDTITKTTVRHPIPTVDFNTVPFCLSDSITLTNATTINAPGAIANNIWNFGDGSAFSTDENPKHKFNTPGVYNITLITSSSNGCVSDITAPVQIYPLPVANFTNTSVCENNPPMNFTDASVVDNGNITSWEWDFGDGNTSTFPIPNNNFTSAGTYDVRLIVTSNYGCKDTVENTVTVDSKPIAEYIVDITEGCSPVCVTFTDNSVSNATAIDKWQWNLGNGEGSSTASPTTCYVNPSNTYDIIYNTSLIVKNNKGCYDTIQKNNLITSWYNPLAQFEATPEELNMYESEVSTLNTSLGADLYEWNFENGLTSNDFEPLINYSDTGIYTITLAVSTINNCVDTAVQPIKVTPVTSIYIPNTFTPNGDGSNDGFIFSGFGIEESTIQFYIYDRWGALIYYTESQTPWDGTYKGDLALQDTYVYVLKCRDVLGEMHDYKGYISLIR